MPPYRSIHIYPVLADELAAAIYRAKPSRLDNVIEIEVAHKADQRIHQTVQTICDHGVRALTLRTVYPRAPWRNTRVVSLCHRRYKM
jgi:hypothetical protein